MKPPAPSRIVSAPRSAPMAPPPARPTRLDFVLIVLGFALSLCLADMSGYQKLGPKQAPEQVPEYVVTLIPALSFLPLGVLLFWPVFYATQRILGRPQALAL